MSVGTVIRAMLWGLALSLLVTALALVAWVGFTLYERSLLLECAAFA